MKDGTAIALAAGVVAGAVYLATRKEAAPEKDAVGTVGAICGAVGVQGDKAGGYGLLAGPACGVAAGLGGLLKKVLGGPNLVGWTLCLKRLGETTGNASVDAELSRQAASKKGASVSLVREAWFKGLVKEWQDAHPREYRATFSKAVLACAKANDVSEAEARALINKRFPAAVTAPVRDYRGT